MAVITWLMLWEIVAVLRSIHHQHYALRDLGLVARSGLYRTVQKSLFREHTKFINIKFRVFDC